MQSCEQYRWAGKYEDDWLVQESFGMHEYIVEANAGFAAPVVVLEWASLSSCLCMNIFYDLDGLIDARLE